MLGPIYQAHGCLELECFGTHQPLDLMRLNETKAVILSRHHLSFSLHLLHQWQLPGLGLLKSGHVQLAYLRGRALEDLGQHSVGHERRVTMLINQFSKFKLNEIADHRLSEFLHGKNLEQNVKIVEIYE